MENLLRLIPADISGELIEREETCRVCNEKMGEKIAVVDYWNIKTSRLIKCSKCNHIQLDPMLTDSETSKGCNAFYFDQSTGPDNEEDRVNYVRNFRRGVVFGYSLKRKKILPHSILELGPGSGYFCDGLRFVFPEVEITVLDINSNVLNFNKEHHKYRVIHGVPDHFIPEFINMFDLVIARDIIEHVSDISKVVKNVYKYLTPNGYFHFITPNGQEDVWKHYLTSTLTDSPSELLINHVNYYDGKGLRKFLFREGFIPLKYYTYTIKTTLRGRGWKRNKKLMNPVSMRKNADLLIRRQNSRVSDFEWGKEKILDKWYIQYKAKWITHLYSIYQHISIFRMNPELNIGHEIYGLFKKY